MPNQTNKQKSQKRKISTTDLIMMALGIFILLRTPWNNMTSFHFLLFFLYIFCIMMRISNLRKQQTRREQTARKEAEATQANTASSAEAIEGEVVRESTLSETAVVAEPLEKPVDHV